VIAGVLLLYAIIGGFFIHVSSEGMEVAAESMRNIFYHVGMWFGMLTMLIIGFIYSLRFLRKFDEREDIRAVEAVNVGLMFGFLGIFTGMIWANFTWGSPWVKDPKLNGAAVGLLIYLAYAILRGSIDDIHKRAKFSLDCPCHYFSAPGRRKHSSCRREQRQHSVAYAPAARHAPDLLSCNAGMDIAWLMDL